MIEYIYTGKTNILQENIRQFLVIANDLKILGLSGDFMIEENVNTDISDNSDTSLNKSAEKIYVQNDDEDEKFNIVKINLPSRFLLVTNVPLHQKKDTRLKSMK